MIRIYDSTVIDAICDADKVILFHVPRVGLVALQDATSVQLLPSVDFCNFHSDGVSVLLDSLVIQALKAEGIILLAV